MEPRIRIISELAPDEQARQDELKGFLQAVRLAMDAEEVEPEKAARVMIWLLYGHPEGLEYDDSIGAVLREIREQAVPVAYLSGDLAELADLAGRLPGLQAIMDRSGLGWPP